MNRKRIILYFLLLSLLCTYLATAENLIKNSGFELGIGALPDFWSVSLWDKKPGTTQITWQTSSAYHGEKCISLTNHAPNDARIIQTIQVREGKIYKISCKIKTQNIGTEATGANISVLGFTDIGGDYRGTNDNWQEMAAYVRIGKGITFIEIAFGLGGYSSLNSGQVLFDDMFFEETTDTTTSNLKVINAGAQTPPQPRAAKKSSHTGIETYLLVIFFAILCVVVLVFTLRRKSKTE